MIEALSKPLLLWNSKDTENGEHPVVTAMLTIHLSFPVEVRAIDLRPFLRMNILFQTESGALEWRLN